jgi:mannose-6-phosphate isomerase-like protein (cupin superfamily)
MDTYLYQLDLEPTAGARTIQKLIGPQVGIDSLDIRCIKTPPREGSPSGLHTHEQDQIFYIISGTMKLEVDGSEHEAGPGTLVVFPVGVPHRNWNEGQEPTIHIAINAPARAIVAEAQ